MLKLLYKMEKIYKMKMLKLKLGIITIAFFMVLPVLMSLTVVAKQAQTQQGSNNSSENANTSSQAQKVATGKLDDSKLKTCQNRERVTSNIMARIVDRGTKQMAVFDSISEKVQTFYDSKGYAFTNYDGLLAIMLTKRTETQTALQTMAQNGTEFNCGGDDPKGAVEAFKERAQLQNGSLDEYKTALKNLLVGVKTAVEDNATMGVTE